MARNRKRRRTRPPGTNPDPRQGLPTATHDFGAAGSSEREPDNGAAGLEPVDLHSDALDEDLSVDSVEDDEVSAREDDEERAPEDDEERAPDDDEERAPDDDEEGAPPPLEHGMPDVELAEEQLAFGRPTEPEPDDEADEDEYETEVEESIAEAGRGRGRGYDGRGASRRSGGAGELAAPSAAAPERAPSLVVRLIGFLQGSWRELHRVQWPDRRQVFQATGVVIGFVIVAAVFLGVADWVAGKLVTFVLK